MVKTSTLETVINEVHQRSAQHYDEIVPVQDMTFDSLSQMWVSRRPVEVLPSAQRLLANRLRVPFSYLSRCPKELQAENLNYWIREEARNRQTLFCRFDDNKLRAVFTERYTAIDHMEVLTKMLEYGFNPETEIHISLDNEIMVLKVPEYERTFRLSENDKVVPGISISNSEVGFLALSIEAFYYRLVCTNGMIAKTAVDARYKHISRKVMDEFPMVLQGVVDQSRHGRDRFMISIGTPVSNPESTIESFARQFQITGPETDIVKRAYYQEEGATMFHVINAFTRAAQDPSLSATDSYRLEKTGGHILAMVKS
ncbi:MAG: DUF932 domain-containing protein [Desulfobacterales bacterium]|jgi:hypothetical protein|nr:DUF932 domain-containing protein [Desulfobacterales bacterium]